MKFGLLYELQLPKPLDGHTWEPGAEQRVYEEMLEQVELADRVGFDYVFEVEHHFLEEYSHSSAPEMVLAALSQRTSRIRLGHGIVLMPPGYNHPARIAERLGALDILSGGRVEWGGGESGSVMELDGFGVDPLRKKAMWEETTREVANMMASEPYAGYEGEFFSMPSRNVIPKPVQKPHPPLWIAASRRETTMMAARFGLGSLGFGFESPEEIGERTAEYYRILREECMPIGHAINPAISMLGCLMCAETDDEAARRFANGSGFMMFSQTHYYNPETGAHHRPAGENLFQRFMSREQPAGDSHGPLYPERVGAGIGSEDSIRTKLKLFEDAHLDMLLFAVQLGAQRHEHILESIERFGTKVLPEFRDRHEVEHRAWRKRQLDGIDFPVNSSI